ncbi:ChbG/HpnK family deacetylase [Acetobacteraceae bacterium]|nr:ChbG/HpnK family deacetylase [Acetobacteraceae bacterium]
MKPLSQTRQVLFSADDFGMSVEINEAIEKAHLNGILSTTSLMVAGPAAEDAIARAKKLPNLKIGLHLVVIEGESLLHLPAITDEKGWFGGNGVQLGFNYFFNGKARKALHCEIAAQFKKFHETGLHLDHANAHKHMHLHPLVGQYLLKEGPKYGLKAVRIPNEPLKILGEKPRISATILQNWTKILRCQIQKAGMTTTDYCFGIEWSGKFTKERLRFLLPRLPKGSSEIYFHPATSQNERLQKLMPAYAQEEELQTLLDPKIPDLLSKEHITPIHWQNL